MWLWASSKSCLWLSSYFCPKKSHGKTGKPRWITPRKTNMTENPPWMKMYFLLKMGIFQCHVSFQGCIVRFILRILAWHTKIDFYWLSTVICSYGVGAFGFDYHPSWLHKKGQWQISITTFLHTYTQTSLFPNCHLQLKTFVIYIYKILVELCTLRIRRFAPTSTVRSNKIPSDDVSSVEHCWCGSSSIVFFYRFLGCLPLHLVRSI